MNVHTSHPCGCFFILKKSGGVNINKNSQKDVDLINEKIRFKEALVIGPNGEQLGIKLVSDAMIIAKTAELDLVCVSPKGNPPVCKIMDYGKHRYESQKKLKENKKNQKITVIKEIRLTVEIGENDIATKAKNARKFLEKDDKVKVFLRFKGRQITHASIGFDVVKKFCALLDDVSEIEKPPTMAGRGIEAYLTPKK